MRGRKPNKPLWNLQKKYIFEDWTSVIGAIPLMCHWFHASYLCAELSLERYVRYYIGWFRAASDAQGRMALVETE